MKTVYCSMWLVLGLLLSAASVYGAQWHATQGDIALLHHEAADSVTVFGKQWPLRAAADGGVVAFVGVDIAQKAEIYPVVWRGGAGESLDHLVVDRGSFPISKITVDRAMAQFDSKQLQMIRRDQRLLRESYGQHVDIDADFHFISRPVAGVVSTPLGARRIVNGEPRSPHSGIDIAAAAGTEVHLPAAGVVLLTAAMYLNGNSVVVGHGDGLVEIFSHLRTIAVRQGEHLMAGAVIGEVGATGRATGPHLHWGVRFAGARVSPQALLAAEERR
ncbi:MAG: M23 family metallopeptidase [Mariprofundales bacterium]|nr:M23 family metallopeptidase [Mariprofundales bacterium]